MNIICRQIKEEDKETINSLYEKLLDDHGASVGIRFGYGYYIWNKIFSKEKNYNAFVASLLNSNGEESEIVGYIMLELNKAKAYSFIQGLFVEEKYRHNGIAKRLINEAENYSKSIGCKVIKAEVRDYLFRYYKALGFSIFKWKNDYTCFICKNLERNVEVEKENVLER